RG
ncbi:hypothetical protein CFC21_046368, partial [Triticum aestivum]